jgi:alanyl-tRNA synthetase
MDLKADKKGDTLIKGEAYSKMDNYIVDTGYGLERFAWASKGSPTIYDALFPGIVNELMGLAGIEHELDNSEYANILAQNARLAGFMDVSEKANLIELRKKVASSIGMTVENSRLSWNLSKRSMRSLTTHAVSPSCSGTESSPPMSKQGIWHASS